MKNKRKKAILIIGVWVVIAAACVIAIDIVRDVKEMLAMPTPTVAPTATLEPIAVTITQTVLIAIETMTPVPVECVWSAEYVTDTTVLDGTVMAPGDVFTKTWQVLNTSNCPFKDVRLIFAGWTQMTDVESVAVDETEPGSDAFISVVMVAPTEPGHYIGAWAMCLSGDCFCQLTVDIQVNE